MDPQDKHDRERVISGASAIIAAAHESCVDSAKHVYDSRKLIARSLRLLGESFQRLGD